MNELYILLLALVIDLALGDPPTVLHPVGWMGKFISFLERFAPGSGVSGQFLYGIGIVLLGTAAFSIPAYLLLTYLEGINRIAYVIVGALLLKSTFSITGLRRSALQVRDQLIDNDLKGAQAHIGALVSRNTDGLSGPLLVAATVESVAENTSDSIVAPLFWFLLLGVPGAIAYRMVNTCDSMIGYHGKYEHLGKFAARLDDVLNFIPARLTGIMIVLAAFLAGKSASASWFIMVRDHARTQSPNAGWPMSAAAGALAIQLQKVGHYSLGDASSPLVTQKIDSMLHLMYLVASIWILVCCGIEGVRLAFAS